MKTDEPMTPEEAKKLSKQLSFAGKHPKTATQGDQTAKQEASLKTKKHRETPEADILEPTLRSALDLGRIDTFGEAVKKSVLDLIVEAKQAAWVEHEKNKRASAREKTKEGAAEGSPAPVSMEKQAEAEVAKNNETATKPSITGNTTDNSRLKSYFSSPAEHAAWLNQATSRSKKPPITTNPTPGLGGRESKTVSLSEPAVKPGESWKNVQNREADKTVSHVLGELGKGIAASKSRTDADYAKQLEMRREQKSSTKSPHDTFNMLKGSIQRIKNEKGGTSYKGGTFFGRIGARINDFLGTQRSGKDMESSVNAWDRSPNDTDRQAQSGYGKNTRISTYPEDAFDKFSSKTALPTSKEERDELDQPTIARHKERFAAEQAAKEAETAKPEPEAPKPTEPATDTPPEAEPAGTPKKGPSMRDLLARGALPDASDPEALKKAGIPTTGEPPAKPAPEAKPAPAAPAEKKTKLTPEQQKAKKQQEDEVARQKGFKQGTASGVSSRFKNVLNTSYTAWAARKSAELAAYAESVKRRT